MVSKKQIYSSYNCAICGSTAAEGIMKFPVCKKCYKERFNNSPKKYDDYIKYRF